jgi:hypothetical protein
LPFDWYKGFQETRSICLHFVTVNIAFLYNYYNILYFIQEVRTIDAR